MLFVYCSTCCVGYVVYCRVSSATQLCVLAHQSISGPHGNGKVSSSYLVLLSYLVFELVHFNIFIASEVSEILFWCIKYIFCDVCCMYVCMYVFYMLGERHSWYRHFVYFKGSLSLLIPCRMF